MSDLPHLVTPITEASEKILKQIAEGNTILSSLVPPEGLAGFTFDMQATFAQAQSTRERWAKYTFLLLERMFTDDSPSREFGDHWINYFPHEDEIDGFRRDMKERIIALVSIHDRLSIYPTAGQPLRAKAVSARPSKQSTHIFIVHGHDAAKHEVARFIEKLALNPIILHEQADKGQTVIEKFETHSNVGFAIVILTPDDMGYPKDKPSEAKPQARQNVVLELGFFLGKLGRSRVCALLKGEIELPSNYAGVLYKKMDDTGAWKLELAREIRDSGIDVDLNNAV